jgi:hypothetical protein
MEVQKDAKKTHWKIKYSNRCSTKLPHLPDATQAQRFAIHLSFHLDYATADPIRTKKPILRLPRLHSMRTSSWHPGNAGSCGTNMLIPHSAKGLKLLHQRNHCLSTTCGTGARGSTYLRGEVGEHAVKDVGMDAALTKGSECWHGIWMYSCVSYSTPLLCFGALAPQVKKRERLSRRRDRIGNSLDTRVPNVTHARVAGNIAVKSVSWVILRRTSPHLRMKIIAQLVQAEDVHIDDGDL